MKKPVPFLWFNDNAGEAAAFYLQAFPNARKLDELLSSGVGPWPAGHVATVRIELEGQEMIFMNGGPSQQLSPSFSFTIECESQQEIDDWWEKLVAGGKPMACGWLTDRFGLCWQITPVNMAKLVRHPKAMQAMMTMIKLDIAALEAAAQEA